jgi:hypothetical protein
VMPCSKLRVVEEAKDLNPFRFMLFKYIDHPTADAWRKPI